VCERERERERGREIRDKEREREKRKREKKLREGVRVCGSIHSINALFYRVHSGKTWCL